MATTTEFMAKNNIIKKIFDKWRDLLPSFRQKNHTKTRYDMKI